jgi:hypothetical protein
MIPQIRLINPDFYFSTSDYIDPEDQLTETIPSLLEVRQIIHSSRVLTLTSIDILEHWESTRGSCPNVGRLPVHGKSPEYHISRIELSAN